MEHSDDAYTVLAAAAHAETKVEGSRFIADALPVEGRDAAGEFLEGVRKKYFDATHHCYAYRLGTTGEQFRAHDDGEPSGSAGKPILAMIDRAGVTDVLVVVTRYFGGTKLGVGGLLRAYGGAADAALRAAPRLVRYAMDPLDISFPHSLVSPVMRAISLAEARIIETIYGDAVRIRLVVRRTRTASLRTMIINLTGGKAVLQDPP
jgi:uncharacterized YigZ family protein